MVKVSLKPLKGETFTVEADEEATVEELKRKIAEAKPEYAPPELQKLIYAGKVLADAATIRESEVKPGSAVVIMLTKAKAPAGGAASEAAAAAPPAAAPAASAAASGAGVAPAVFVAGLSGAAAPSYVREAAGQASAAGQGEALEDRLEGPEDGLPRLPKHPSEGAVRNVVVGRGTWLRAAPGSVAAQYWYRVRRGEGKHRFVLVTAGREGEDGGVTSAPLFDHEALARALGGGVEADAVPLDDLAVEVGADGALVLSFSRRGVRCSWSDRAGLKRGVDGGGPARGLLRPASQAHKRTARDGPEVSVHIENFSSQKAEVFWLGRDGARIKYGEVAAGDSTGWRTFAGHVWLLAACGAAEGSAEAWYGTFETPDCGGEVTLDDEFIAAHAAAVAKAEADARDGSVGPGQRALEGVSKARQQRARGLLRPASRAHVKTERCGPAAPVLIRNASSQKAEVFWLDGDGARVKMGEVAAGDSNGWQTHAGYRWLLSACGAAAGSAEAWYGTFEVPDSDGEVLLDNEFIAAHAAAVRGEAAPHGGSVGPEQRAVEGVSRPQQQRGRPVVSDGEDCSSSSDEAGSEASQASGGGGEVCNARWGRAKVHEHPLLLVRGGSGWVCDECRGPGRGERWRSLSSDYDLCPACWRAFGGESSELSGVSQRRAERGSLSPDGRWLAWVSGHNVRAMRLGEAPPGAARLVDLTTDGRPGDAYSPKFLVWAPGSDALAAARVSEARPWRLPLLQSSPLAGGARPRIRRVKYRKPGDAMPGANLVVLRPPAEPGARGAGAVVAVRGDLFPEPFTENGPPSVRWLPSGEQLVIDYVARSRRMRRWVAVERASGRETVLWEEDCEAEGARWKFVDSTCNKLWSKWVARKEGCAAELLFLSETDGWCHVWAMRWAHAGGKPATRQLTRGEWVVKEVLRVDELKRLIWFAAGGIVPGHDPCYAHICRAPLDAADGGPHVTVLTADAEGTHSADFSPCGRFFVDTWSRVDLPPVVQLRCAHSGARLLELERADASALIGAGWAVPERFCAPGRDGQTDIHGILLHPAGASRGGGRRCPVVEQIYAGPHGAHCPKAWGLLADVQAIVEAGFVVVMCDGMGTNGRGRAFLEVCWQNLRDAGLPDRKAWIRAAARQRPWMDLSRVGIYGGSAGGQNAVWALLVHDDLYRVAVADCGCYDNRVDKLWWNEQWLGYPVSDCYSRNSCAGFVGQLDPRSHLMLVVGEVDDNVDPACTMRLVKALQEAQKDFELVVISGQGHSAADTPYGKRKRLQFLIRHLQPADAAAGPGRR